MSMTALMRVGIVGSVLREVVERRMRRRGFGESGGVASLLFFALMIQRNYATR